MSSLTQLSDAELDAVTGGSFTVFKFTEIAANFNATQQSQLNVGVLQLGVKQGGSQSNGTVQVAHA